METFLAVMALLFVSLQLGDWDHKTSIGATIEYNIRSNQVIKEDDVYISFHHRVDDLKLTENYKSRNQLWFVIDNGFWYPPGRVVFDNNTGVLYLYTQSMKGLYPQFFYDSVQIASYLDRKGIAYCIRHKGIWTEEMMQSEEVKSLDSKKCKEEGSAPESRKN
jgi:hypothetical protein